MTSSRPLLHIGRLTLASVLSIVMVGTGSQAGTAATTTAGARSATTAFAFATGNDTLDDPVDYVVAISVDGLNPHAIRRLGPSGAPNFYRLIAEGATTQNARTSYEQTITLPNHTGMLTGRRILGRGGHHVTISSDNGRTVAAMAGHYVKSIFDVVHNHGGSTAFYSAKSKLNFLNRSWDAAHGQADRVGANNGRDKIDRYYVDTEYANVTRLLARMHSSPDELSFVHLAYPDRSGHKHGFMSAAYVHAVFQADRQIGRIMAAVRHDPRLRAHMNLVLTADHGGKGANHSNYKEPANYIVPFMVWGRGVARGADLYDLNTEDRARPAWHRPTYAGRQPIRNMELANVVADLLDLNSVPGSIANTGQGLDVN